MIDTEYSSCLIQLFTSVTNINTLEEIIFSIKDLLPNSTIIGATTDGEIIDGISHTETTVVSITTFEETTLNIDFIDYNSSDSNNFQEIGQSLASKIIQNNTKAVIIFSDGLNTNGEDLVKGFEQIKPDLIIAGGLAGDNGQFKNTFVICNNKIINYASVAVSLNSDTLSVKTTYDFNYQAIGKDLKITKANKNRVYEINGIVALDIYAKYLGDEIAEMLPSIGVEFPLIMHKDGIDTARAVLQKHDDGSLTFGGNIHTGDIVNLGYGVVEHILTKSINTLSTYKDINAQSIFIYSCMARRRLLGLEVNKEIAPLNSIAPTSGFFTYGEYFHFGSHNQFLNQTMTILFLSEDINLRKDIVIQDEAINNHNNHIIKALSNLVKVSTNEIKAKNKQLLKQEKILSKSEAIAAISHQWRQPLSVLSLIISKMKFYNQNNLLDDTKLENFLEDSELTVDKLSNIIDKFKMLFLHIDNDVKPIIIQDIFSSFHLKYTDKCKTYNINSNLNLGGHDLNIIHTDADKLIDVMDIIYENAIEAIIDSDTSDKLIIKSLDIKHNKLEISIFNSGNQINQDILSNLFNPYYSTKDENERGLGLYIAKIIIEHHLNGELIASSNSSGTTFKIILNIDKDKE